MARVYFSSNKNHPLSESHYKFGYVIDLLNLGYTIDHSGIDLGNIEAKTSYIDIEGADGQIDVTNALTDDVHYKNRHMYLCIVQTDCQIDSHLIRYFQGST